MFYCSMTMAGKTRNFGSFYVYAWIPTWKCNKEEKSVPINQIGQNAPRSSTQSWPTDWAVAYLGEIAQCLNVPISRCSSNCIFNFIRRLKPSFSLPLGFVIWISCLFLAFWQSLAKPFWSQIFSFGQKLKWKISIVSLSSVTLLSYMALDGFLINRCFVIFRGVARPQISFRISLASRSIFRLGKPEHNNKKSASANVNGSVQVASGWLFIFY